jgi:uncharacterized membrane protein
VKRSRLRRLIRLIGWLLTPVVVWAASFLGGWLGASVGKSLGYMVWTGVATGTLAFVGWVWLAWWRAREPLDRLERRRKMREKSGVEVPGSGTRDSS